MQLEYLKKIKRYSKASLARILGASPFGTLRDGYKGVCTILMYHRVVDPQRCSSDALLAISPSDFEVQIGYIAANCKPLSMQEAVSRLKTNSLPENAVVITFDDGFKDNLRCALPILERYNVPASIFITTRFIDGALKPWWDNAAELLSWSEVLELSKHPLITIGAHTLSHPELSALSESDLKYELAESKRIIEEKTGKPVAFLAYPYGTYKHANGREYEFAKACGFQAALTTNPGALHKHHAQDLFALPRYTVDGRLGLEEFIRQLSGVNAMISSIANAFPKKLFQQNRADTWR